jgi:hypothetical protein
MKETIEFAKAQVKAAVIRSLVISGFSNPCRDGGYNVTEYYRFWAGKLKYRPNLKSAVSNHRKEYRKEWFTET